jgi:hypothetical protein
MDKRLFTDLQALSTDGLCIVWAICAEQRKTALMLGNDQMAEEFSARLRACDREIASRQLDFDDELNLLRERNRLAGGE